MCVCMWGGGGGGLGTGVSSNLIGIEYLSSDCDTSSASDAKLSPDAMI